MIALAAPCPAQCGRIQKAGKFLCLTCWLALPRDLSRNVNRTWREIRELDRTKHPSEYFAALRNYKQARGAALKYLALHPAMTPGRAAVEELFKEAT